MAFRSLSESISDILYTDSSINPNIQLIPERLGRKGLKYVKNIFLLHFFVAFFAVVLYPLLKFF